MESLYEKANKAYATLRFGHDIDLEAVPVEDKTLGIGFKCALDVVQEALVGDVSQAEFWRLKYLHERQEHAKTLVLKAKLLANLATLSDRLRRVDKTFTPFEINREINFDPIEDDTDPDGDHA